MVVADVDECRGSDTLVVVFPVGVHCCWCSRDVEVVVEGGSSSLGSSGGGCI